MKIQLFLVASLFSVVSSFGQRLVKDNTPELLEWNEYYDLTWEDFMGDPDEESIGDAGTAVHIKAKPYYVKDQIMYDVEAYFNRKKSWSRDKSDDLLKHEKLHFDIAELYARIIRKKISDMKERGINDIKQYNAAIRELLKESNDVDERYDLETLHGSLSKRQEWWETKIKEQLMGLKDYKKKKRVITVKDALKKNPHIFG